MPRRKRVDLDMARKALGQVRTKPVGALLPGDARADLFARAGVTHDMLSHLLGESVQAVKHALTEAVIVKRGEVIADWRTRVLAAELVFDLLGVMPSRARTVPTNVRVDGDGPVLVQPWLQQITAESSESQPEPTRLEPSPDVQVLDVQAVSGA